MLTAEKVNSLLSYDRNTGVLRWKEMASSRRPAGSVAGNIMGNGYRYIGINGKRYKASRLIWLMIHGEWPKEIIDHINGDSLDDRLCNLREATESQNRCNVSKYKNNQSGYKGVYFDKRRGKWVAEIKFEKKRKWLGRFKTAELAHQAYVNAAKELHKEYARVN